MNKQIIFSIILIMTTFCSTRTNKDIDYIIFGEYCGECYGHCATMYKLDNNHLLLDSSDNYFKNRNKLDHGLFKGDTLSKEKFDLVKNLKDKFPKILIMSSDKVFGEPDNRDQCGIYIQVKIGNKIRVFTIDTDLDKIPIELRDFTKIIMKLTKEI